MTNQPETYAGTPIRRADGSLNVTVWKQSSDTFHPGLGRCMVIDASFFRCFFCGRRFSPDLEAKEGGFIHSWRVAACNRCMAGNRDGLSADHPAIRQLVQLGIIQKPSEPHVSWPDENTGTKPGAPL